MRAVGSEFRCQNLFVERDPVFAGIADVVGADVADKLFNAFRAVAGIAVLAVLDGDIAEGDFDPSLTGSFDWSAADGLIYFAAEDRDYVRLYQLNLQTGNKSARQAC